MSEPQTSAPKLGLTEWLIITIASIGFLFDTYELLMTPLVAAPAIAELLKVPMNNPLVTDWVGRLLWIAALCGGVFGLLGGWLVDKFGRKTIILISTVIFGLFALLTATSGSMNELLMYRFLTGIDLGAAMPNIPPKVNRKWRNCFSPFLYRNRNAIERMFCRLKDFRRVATRYDRNAVNFLAAVCIAAAVSYWL